MRPPWTQGWAAVAAAVAPEQAEEVAALVYLRAPEIFD
jgi:hypothetical protein